jgi:hypothetical protein
MQMIYLWLRKAYDFIIVDTPPVGVFIECHPDRKPTDRPALCGEADKHKRTLHTINDLKQ